MASRSAARLTSDLPPCLDTSMHKGAAWTCSLEYVAMKEGKRAEDCCKQLLVSVYVHGWHGDLVSGCWTTGPSLDPHFHLLPQMCSSGLFVGGQEGGITPGMIRYYWARLPFSSSLVLLAGPVFILLPVMPPLN